MNLIFPGVSASETNKALTPILLLAAALAASAN